MARTLAVVPMLALCMSFAGQATAGKKPPPSRPPTPHNRHAAEISQLTRELDKVRSAEWDALAKVQHRYADEVNRLNLPARQMEVIALWWQRNDAIAKIDNKALRAVEAKYRPKIKELESQLATRNKKVQELYARLYAATANIEKRYDSQMASVGGNIGSLEAKLWAVLGERDAELLKMINSPVVRKWHTEMQAEINALSARILSRQKKLQSIELHKLKQLAAAENHYAWWVQKVTNGSRPDVQLARLLEKQRLELAEAPNETARTAILNANRGELESLEIQVAAQQTRLTELATQKTEKIAEIESVYLEAVAVLDSLETLQAELAELRIIQVDMLLPYVAIEKAQAILNHYEPRIDALAAKIVKRDVQVADILTRMLSHIAQATTSTRAEIARLTSAEEGVEFKLVALYEQQWADVLQAVGRANIQGVLHKYDPEIAKASKRLAAAEQDYLRYTQRALNDWNGIVRTHEPHIARLQRRINELIAIGR
jgi:hypothetical protein